MGRNCCKRSIAYSNNIPAMLNISIETAYSAQVISVAGWTAHSR